MLFQPSSLCDAVDQFRQSTLDDWLIVRSFYLEILLLLYSSLFLLLSSPSLTYTISMLYGNSMFGDYDNVLKSIVIIIIIPTPHVQQTMGLHHCIIYYHR